VCVCYLGFKSVGDVFEIGALFFKSGDSTAQTLGFLLRNPDHPTNNNNKERGKIK
jgi:hypothetical protein